jgi:beta-lactamase class A
MSTASRRTLIAGAAASLCSGLAAARDPLADIEAKVGGRLGVAALEVSSGRRLAYRGDERFAMCSTFKAMAVSAVLKRVDDGRERLDRFVRYGPADLQSYAPVTRTHVADGGMKLGDLCAAAIELSDNTAANLILASIGGPPGWTRFVRSLGDAESRLDRNEPTLNTAIVGDPRDTATPRAMVADLKATLIEPRVLSESSRGLLKSWMLATQTGLTKLRAGMPATWQVADKTGNDGRTTSNDIAVAWTPAGPIVVVCYLTEAGGVSQDARDGAIAEVGRVVAQSFAGPGAAPHG